MLCHAVQGSGASGLPKVGSRPQVADVATKEVRRNPLLPFITSTMQQDASSRLGFSPSSTMQLAQQLYEGSASSQGEHPLRPSPCRQGGHRVSSGSPLSALHELNRTHSRTCTKHHVRSLNGAKSAPLLPSKRIGTTCGWCASAEQPCSWPSRCSLRDDRP